MAPVYLAVCVAASLAAAPLPDKPVEPVVQTGWLGSVFAVAFGADGKRATASMSKNVILWDATTGQILRILSSDTFVGAVALTPDGKSAHERCQKHQRLGRRHGPQDPGLWG